MDHKALRRASLQDGRSSAVEVLLTRDSGLVIKLGMKEGLFDVC